MLFTTDRSLYHGLIRIAVIAVLALPSFKDVRGQDVDFEPPPSPVAGLPLQSVLFEAQELAESGIPLPELADMLSRRGVVLLPNGKVLTEVAPPDNGAPLSGDVIAPFGGEITGSAYGRVETLIPVLALTAVAEALPAGYYLEAANRPGFDDVVGEGPAVTGTDEYRDNGIDGTGITIAVIDFGFSGLSAAILNGDAPTVMTQINLTDEPFQARYIHGTGCVETAFDHCPGATWRLYRIGSLTDLGEAVQDCIDNGVNVITHSISWFNTGWDDDSGLACQAATEAANAGILFFTSAGNRAQQHWQGDYNSIDGDRWHDFSPYDETINISVAGGAEVSFHLSWDRSGGPFDYDLFLYDSTWSTVLGSSTNSPDNYESVTWTNPNSSSEDVHLMVFERSGGSTELEIFATGAATLSEYRVAAGSTASPSNSTHSRVFSIGAVDEDNYGQPPGGGTIASYSSNGPSNGGMTLPDFTAPTNTANFTYVVFGGTSCAAPNAAGVAAVLWSCSPGIAGSVVRSRLISWALCRKDWGSSGLDDVFGYGGINLLPYADCDSNGIVDACEILEGFAADSNCNGFLDVCELITYEFEPGEVIYPFETGLALFEQHLLVDQDLDGVGLPTEGFSMSYQHDPEYLMASEVLPGASLAELNGGTGPDYFMVDLSPEGLAVSVVYDVLGDERVTIGQGEPLIIVLYQSNPASLMGNPHGATTTLTWTDGFGDPPVSNQVLAGGQSIAPLLEDGSLTLLPDMVAGTLFIRGDVDGNGVFNGLVDGISLLQWGFQSGALEPPCMAAADADADGVVSPLADAVRILAAVFVAGTPPIAAPHPDCGLDQQTVDLVGCEQTQCP